MHPIVQKLVEFGIDPRDAVKDAALFFMAQELVMGARQPLPAPPEAEAPPEPQGEAAADAPTEAEADDDVVDAEAH